MQVFPFNIRFYIDEHVTQLSSKLIQDSQY